MSRHTPREANLRLSVRHIIGAGGLLLASLSVPPRPAAAQSTTSLQTDATVLPRRKLSVRLPMSFTRFDELVGDGGTLSIAAGFNADSITSAQIGQLAFTESSIRALTADPAFRATAGNLVAAANSRVVTAPLILEYGFTKRLTLGVVIPIVETRSTLFAQLNPRIGVANVGANPGATGWSGNASLVTSLRAAATALQTRLTQCSANPAGTGCAALLAQQSEARSLIDATTPFASALEGLYGTSGDRPGAFFVPLNNSPAQTAVITQLTTLRTKYQSFGGTVAQGVPTGAVGPSAQNDLQAILAVAGYDSLKSTDHSSFGDITIGGTLQLANTFGDSARIRSGGLLYRLAVNAGGRIGTGQPANRNRLFDNATGYGQPGVIAGAAADLRLTPRYFLTALGSYTMQLGSVIVSRPATTNVFPLSVPYPTSFSAGDVAALTLVPRIRLSGLFSLDGVYSLFHVAADEYTLSAVPALLPTNPPALAGFGSPAATTAATSHQVGFGFSYSTLNGNDAGPGRLPFEASFRHTELLKASGGPLPKAFVDQLQLRVFFR